MNVTDETLKLLLDAARAQNEYVGKQSGYDRRRAVETSAPVAPKGDRPGDHFNAREKWDDWLPKWGWKHMGGRYWKRPGKDAPGLSATVGYCKGEAGNALLYVFSTNATPFDAETTYSLFAAYALIEFDGDYSAAAQDLTQKGYGEAAAEINFRPAPVPATAPVPEAGAETATEAGKPAKLFLETHELRRLPPGEQWLLSGYLSRGGITLLSAIWKVGKTTWLAHLLRAFDGASVFCGQAVKPCRVLFVSEESEHLWAERRDNLGLGANVGWMCRPFTGRPTPQQWADFLGKVKEQAVAYQFDAVIFDTLAKLWPVRDENDAVQVDNALMPLWPITEKSGLLLVHHLRKSGGEEATGSRGSGALTAFVETIVEMRRFEPGNRKDRKRVLTGYGRYQETPDELVIELSGDGYIVVSEDRKAAHDEQAAQAILSVLPNDPPGLTVDEIHGCIEMRRTTLILKLKQLDTNAVIIHTGSGTRGDPHKFYCPVSKPVALNGRKDSVPVPTPPMGTGTESEPANVAEEAEDREAFIELVVDEVFGIVDRDGEVSEQTVIARTGYAIEDVADALAKLVSRGRIRRVDYPDAATFVANR